MTNLILAGLAAALAGQVPYTQTPAPVPPTPPSATPATPAGPAAPNDLVIPELQGTIADPTCGGRSSIAQQAFCVSTTQAAMEGIVDQYNSAFQQQGWVAAGGENNRIIYVKRKDGGGCLAFQLLAFADETRPAAPGAPGYFAFANIPGDICISQAAPSASTPLAE